MNMNEALEKPIRIYWWNFGKKTLEFKGSYRDYLKKREIKIKDRGKNFFEISFDCGTNEFKIKTYETDYDDMLDNAIKIFLTCLGDKAKFEGHRREYKINWR